MFDDDRSDGCPTMLVMPVVLPIEPIEPIELIQCRMASMQVMIKSFKQVIKTGKATYYRH